MKKVKVVIVDDSAFMRQVLKGLLEEDGRIEVIGTLRNGKDALEKLPLLQPDVVTMDVEMPIMDGLETLQQLMKEYPLPVVMCSSTTKEGAENTIIAMQYGAVDFITKPTSMMKFDSATFGYTVIDKVVSAASANIGRKVHDTSITPVVLPFSPSKGKKKKLVCIGVSTGGPRALQEVLAKFPAEIDFPVLIVQHMPAGFTKSLAVRLNACSQITVKEAEHGESLQNGVAYIAPGDFHMKIMKKGMTAEIGLTKEAPRRGHRPSVDTLFESLVGWDDYHQVHVVMTGMGSDGTEGLVALKREQSVITIAQSKETSVVFGMPKSAIAASVVDHIVDVEEIAKSIMKYSSL
ncbi:protein-glutamate methylesterase/protein-glutamine glutaminase [Priestia taiwanensis]|uniref:Protein-glutamate methylesterase/protein-glutamine glutaminase n=1 Tax=Priestia taiwanensis TaxID=1347902 RepID=A0A917AQ04_9BACI|nr:chemotaxis response regulator protein-glutamate methylesterase [Priestia taiwanensis]MBM7362822.1 two-component system chemotaxis response regulator CheB [Priestia taiwanensis]GGE65381.1 chemotaxis response regulator protein-glutamate methylesterase [Priestia taiwanensis]